MPDPFADACPNPLPLVSDMGTGISAHVPQFTSPYEASFYIILYFLDDEVTDTLICEWMNAQPTEYFTVIGKQKVNELL